MEDVTLASAVAGVVAFGAVGAIYIFCPRPSRKSSQLISDEYNV